MAYQAVLITSGSGTSIAVDTVAGQQIQVVKLDVGTDGVSTPVSTAAPLPVLAKPFASGGCSSYHVVSAASTNPANIKASAGQVYGVQIFNNSVAPIYVKLHNTAGTPTAGTGVVRTFGVQGGTALSRAFPYGIAFSTGIGITIVSAITDAGTTAVALSDCVVDIDWA